MIKNFALCKASSVLSRQSREKILNHDLEFITSYHEQKIAVKSQSNSFSKWLKVKAKNHL